MPIRYDRNYKISSFDRTPQGFLRLPVSIARADCILTYYRKDGSEVKEFRPKSEVFHQDSMDSALDAPVSVGHVAMVNPANAKEVSIGHQRGEITAREDFLDTEVIVEDWEAINSVENGDLVDISPGYNVQIDKTPGVFNGERYDQIQRQITYNHIALLPKGTGRQGSGVGLRMDSNDELVIDKIESEELMKVTIRLDGKAYEVEVASANEAQILNDLNSRCDEL